MSCLEHAFRKAVQENVSSYLPGFAIEQESQWSFRVFSGTLSLHFGCDWTNVVYVLCWLEPSSSTLSFLPDTGGVFAGGVNLHNVIKCIAPNVPDSVIYPKPMMFGFSVKREVKRQLGVVLHYCGNLMAGDTQSWLSLFECLRDDGFRRRDNETDEDYSNRLLYSADKAWRFGRYWDVDRAYSTLLYMGRKLTLFQRFRLWRAQKHIYLMR